MRGECYTFYSDWEEIEVDENIYRVEVRAEAHGWSTPGSYWDPPDGEFDIDKVESTWHLLNDDGDEVEQVEPTEEMKAKLEDWLYDHADDFDTEEMEPEEEYDPWEGMYDGE